MGGGRREGGEGALQAAVLEGEGGGDGQRDVTQVLHARTHAHTQPWITDFVNYNEQGTRSLLLLFFFLTFNAKAAKHADGCGDGPFEREHEANAKSYGRTSHFLPVPNIKEGEKEGETDRNRRTGQEE